MSKDDPYLQEEAAALDRMEAAIAQIVADAEWFWHWGDGYGGAVILELEEQAKAAGYELGEPKDAPARSSKKAKIGRELAKSVMERDEYRCVECGTHIDLCCDHLIPESRGGPTSFENLQTMCRPCNSRKGTTVHA